MAPAPITYSQVATDAFFRLTSGTCTASINDPATHLVGMDAQVALGDVDGFGLFQSSTNFAIEFTMNGGAFASMIQVNDASEEGGISYTDDFQLGLPESAYPYKLVGLDALTSDSFQFNSIMNKGQTSTIDIKISEFLTINGDGADNVVMYGAMVDAALPVAPGNLPGTSVLAQQQLWDNLQTSTGAGEDPNNYLSGTGLINPDSTVQFVLTTGDAIKMGVSTELTTQLYYDLRHTTGSIPTNAAGDDGNTGTEFQLVAQDWVGAVVGLSAAVGGIGAAGDTAEALAGAGDVSAGDVLSTSASFGEQVQIPLVWGAAPILELANVTNASISGMVMDVIDTSDSAFDPVANNAGYLAAVQAAVAEKINSGHVMGMMGKEPDVAGGQGAEALSLSICVPFMGKNAAAASASAGESPATAGNVCVATAEYQLILRFRKYSDEVDALEQAEWTTHGISA